MNKYRPPTTFERNRIDILHNKGFSIGKVQV